MNSQREGKDIFGVNWIWARNLKKKNYKPIGYGL